MAAQKKKKSVRRHRQSSTKSEKDPIVDSKKASYASQPGLLLILSSLSVGISMLAWLLLTLSSTSDPAPSTSNGTTHYSRTARALADFINSGVSPSTYGVGKLQALVDSSSTDVLGRLAQDETTGWRTRRGSFLELLEETPPRRISEAELQTMPDDDAAMASLFRRPLLVQRTHGTGVSQLESKVHLTQLLRTILHKVKPSRCAALAINYGPQVYDRDTGGFNAELQPHAPGNPGVSFSEFYHQLSAKFDLGTPASSDANIMLQTHGISAHAHQLPWLEKGLARHELQGVSHLQRKYFSTNCINPPALGVAGSLRGLPFHNHPANWNEPVLGRKLWMLYPMRDRQDFSSHACGWPPWNPNGGVPQMLETFFAASPGTANWESPLNSCHDQSLTVLQWIVYELPKIPKTHRPLLFVAQPGETLWIPDGWIHATLNLDDVVHAYRASCAGNAHVASEQEARRDMEELCRETGRFCNDGYYCHSYCTSCEGYKVQCDGEQQQPSFPNTGSSEL